MSYRSRYFVPKDPSVFGSLGTDNKRPRDFRDYRRLFNKVSAHSISNGTSSSLKKFFGRRDGSNRQEIVDLLKKGAIEVCSHTPGEFISNIFTVPKKSGGNRHVIDMRALSEFMEYIPFRMEDISLLKSVLKQGDFMTKLDLRDAYLTVPVNKRSRIYLRFIWRSVLYQFACLPFGLSSSGRIFTKAMKPVIAFLRAMGIRLLIFLDMLNMASSHELAMQHTGLVIQVLTSLGFVINFPKSILIPSKVLPYLGFEVNSDLMKLFLPREKLLNLKRFAFEIMFQVPNASHVASFLGLCQLTMSAILETPPSHQGNTEGSHRGHSPPRATCFLQNQGHPFSGGNKRSAMVDRFSPLKQWKRHNSATCRHNDFLRCLKNRKGCPSGFNPDRGKMIKKEAAFPAFQALVPSAKDLFWYRQPHSHVSYKQARGHSLSNSVKSSNRIMESCPEQKPHNFIHPHSREAECPDRSQIKNFQWFHRMDVQSKDFQGNGSQAWSIRHRPICVESEPPDTGVRIMATRAKCSDDRCFQSDIGLPPELSISSIQPDSSVPQKDTERSSRMHFHCTSLEKQTVVSNSSVNVVTPAFTVTSVMISSSAPRNEQDSHLLYPKVFQTSCMESFRQRLQGQGFPQEVSDILLSSWRKSTARQYESAWRSWSGWCDSWQINCFSTFIKNILTYLADLFHEKGLQHRTINVYRSAISAFHIPIDGMVIGKHPLASKFMKGVFLFTSPWTKIFCDLGR